MLYRSPRFFFHASLLFLMWSPCLHCFLIHVSHAWVHLSFLLLTLPHSVLEQHCQYLSFLATGPLESQERGACEERYKTTPETLLKRCRNALEICRERRLSPETLPKSPHVLKQLTTSHLKSLWIGRLPLEMLLKSLARSERTQLFFGKKELTWSVHFPCLSWETQIWYCQLGKGLRRLTYYEHENKHHCPRL